MSLGGRSKDFGTQKKSQMELLSLLDSDLLPGRESGSLNAPSFSGLCTFPMRR